MTFAVFDSSVIVSGAGWLGDSRRCLVAMARRKARVYTSSWILQESKDAISDLQRQDVLQHDPMPMFNWFSDKAYLVLPVPLGKQRSRDANDDPVLGTALASRARLLVSLDRDLLDLEKPFGIEIMTPRAFLSFLHHH